MLLGSEAVLEMWLPSAVLRVACSRNAADLLVYDEREAPRCTGTDCQRTCAADRRVWGSWEYQRAARHRAPAVALPLCARCVDQTPSAQVVIGIVIGYRLNTN